MKTDKDLSSILLYEKLYMGIRHAVKDTEDLSYKNLVDRICIVQVCDQNLQRRENTNNCRPKISRMTPLQFFDFQDLFMLCT